MAVADHDFDMIRKTRRKKSKAVSATELARMGICQRLVFFEHRYGKRTTASQRTAMQHGLKEHEQFYLDAKCASEKKACCYISTLIFGTGGETTALRSFRDRVLRPHRAGRWFIAVYYRTASGVWKVLERWPWLEAAERATLKTIAWVIARTLR